MKRIILWGGLVVLIVGMAGAIGLYMRPPIDYRVATYPQFNCGSTDRYCNTATAAGLMDIKRYGKGAAFADINGDGFIDIFAADAEPRDNEDWGVSTFYINNGDGSFTATDIGVSDDDLLSSWNGSFADMDNDGDQDLLLVGGGYAGVGRMALYENRMQEEGSFIAVTEPAGLEAENDRLYRWWGIAWADYDNDGFLDFAVSKLYGDALLFRNNGNNTFTNVTAEMGIETPMKFKRDGKNIVWFDYDSDGDQDIYYAGIEGHMFYENLEGKFFLDVTDKVFAGLLPDNRVYTTGAPVVFAAAAADFNQDGTEDLYLGRQIEQDLVLFSDGKGGFSSFGRDIGIDSSLAAKNNEKHPFENTMGLGVGDLFDDGWPDIIIGTGDPVRADADVVFCNRGGVFERCTEVLRDNADGELRTRTHGIVFGDINNDGATDVFQNYGGHAPWDIKSGIDSREQPGLFVQNPVGMANTASLLLEGVESNRNAVGARIKLTATDTHYYTVHSTQAFQSQNDSVIVLALGDATEGVVDVVWPSGVATQIKIAAGTRMLHKEDGELITLK
jgi:hypothetical protein